MEHPRRLGTAARRGSRRAMDCEGTEAPASNSGRCGSRGGHRAMAVLAAGVGNRGDDCPRSDRRICHSRPRTGGLRNRRGHAELSQCATRAAFPDRRSVRRSPSARMDGFPRRGRVRRLHPRSRPHGAVERIGDGFSARASVFGQGTARSRKNHVVGSRRARRVGQARGRVRHALVPGHRRQVTQKTHRAQLMLCVARQFASWFIAHSR